MALDQALQRLAQRAAALNAATNDVNSLLEAIQIRLSELHAGVDGWLPKILALDAETQEAWQIGYGKVSGKWQLVTRQVIVEAPNVTPTAAPVPLIGGAPRRVRVEALTAIESLILYLADKAEAAVGVINETREKFTK